MSDAEGGDVVGDDARALEALADRPPGEKYMLRLYVAGSTPRSARALQSIKRICDEHLAGRYELDVIDVYQQPALVEGDQIVAVPTLIKRLPEPLRRFIGDLSSTEKILLGLDLTAKDQARGPSAP